MRIAACGEDLCATLIRFRWPDDNDGAPVVDAKNVDASQRMRPLLGMTILRNLHRSGESEWEDGDVYNPDDGTNYHAAMSICDDGDLNLRMYRLVSLFGETQRWTRVGNNSQN